MSAQVLGARRVLIVDDDEHTRMLLRDLCESAGYRVSQSRDGEEALEAIRRQPPDLVLLDLNMPRRDGFEVLQELRKEAELSSLPVILLTANGDIDGKIRGMELGADDYVTKPFKLIELQSRISSALLVREYRERLSAAEEELSTLRAVDPLTGAGTYSQLKASLDGELARARRYGRPASVLLLGFDDFQQLRLQLGRTQLDELIADLAQKLRQSLRGADRLFRLEADEFVVLLPETDRRGARIAAERMNAAAGTLSPERLGGHRPVRLRIGGASYPSDPVQTGEDLLREANKSFRALKQTADGKLIFDEAV